MGIGDPREAAIKLVAPLPAGTWTFIGDGIIIEPVDVLFEIIWRDAQGNETTIVQFEQHFELNPDGLGRAVAYEDSAVGAAVPASEGDELVLRYSAVSAVTSMNAYLPNGEGATSGGRIPCIVLR